MKYFKLINDEVVIGVVSSDDFIRYSPIVDCFIRASEENGEYISFQNKLYRTTWMCPMQIIRPYILVQTIEISENEYEIFMRAIHTNEIIEEELEEEEETIEEVPVDAIYADSVEFIRKSKIAEMSNICRKTIENGFDLELRGEVHHFSLDTQDQLNLLMLKEMAQTSNEIPYHADGEICIFYTSEEILSICHAADEFRMYQTTYYNSLKNYINALEDMEDIAAIEYGIDIPAEYKSYVLTTFE